MIKDRAISKIIKDITYLEQTQARRLNMVEDGEKQLQTLRLQLSELELLNDIKNGDAQVWLPEECRFANIIVVED